MLLSKYALSFPKWHLKRKELWKVWTTPLVQKSARFIDAFYKIVWPQSKAIRFSSCCPSYGGVHFIVCLLHRDSIAHSLLNGLERLWKFVSFLCKKGLNLTINTRFVVRVLFFRTYPILNQFVSDMMKCWIMFTAPWFTINVLFVPFMIQL